MKWSVDRIEEDIVVLQNIETKEIIEIDKSKFSFDIKEGMVIKKTSSGFIHDKKEETLRKKTIADKFSKLKKQRD